MPSPATPPPDDDGFRWQGWLQQCEEPVFLLNRRRRLVFANRAWERATGLLLKEVRGQVCRRRTRSVLSDKTEAILAALAPPVDAVQGSSCSARRLLPAIGRDARWVEMTYLPLGAGDKLLGILGVIKALPEAPPALSQPLPEKWLALRDRQKSPLADLSNDSPLLSRLASQIRLAAGQPGLPLSILGPRGTGKLTAARAIHQLSPWRQRYFASLDCDRLPPTVLADLIVGERHPSRPPLGILLLKEPGRLPRELQAQLVDVLDQREENSPWILTAFGADPAAEVSAGNLLESLHCRLTPLVIPLPSLQERREEMPRLIETSLRRAATLLDNATTSIAPEALEILKRHSWPGNFHELNEVIHKAAQRAEAKRIEPAHLPMYLRAVPVPTERTFPLDDILEKVEKRMLALALRLSDGNKKKASDLLGIWRPRLIRRVEALGLETPTQEEPE